MFFARSTRCSFYSTVKKNNSNYERYVIYTIKVEDSQEGVFILYFQIEI